MRSHHRLRSVTRAAVCAVAAFAAVAAVLIGGVRGADEAQAAVASDFDAGSIISDAVFYDSPAMSAAAVQAFLNGKVPNCSSGYTCLRSYSENVLARSADSRCAALPGGSQGSATIIANVAAACGINPQVLLVMLEKEQGLVTATSPTASRYRIAMGYGCPDTAPCDTEYYGFSNQLYNAARQFKVYQSSQNSWNYRAGRANAIQFSPNAACGSSSVYIQNQATAALYIYTPYQPNQAALNNLYGTGDACSSYGNRNFWRLFTDWFGDPRGGSLVLASGNPNVYLVSGTTKYRIPDPPTLQSLMALGPYRTTSQQYIDTLSSGGTVTNLLRDPSTGDVFYLDSSGAKHRFLSCDQMALLGMSCGDAKNLLSAQLTKFPTGGEMTSFVKSASSATVYYLDGGAKRPISTWATLASLYGQQAPYILTVTDARMASYPAGKPLLQVGALVKSASNPQIYMIDGTASKIPVSSFTTASEIGVNGWTTQSDADLANYATAPSALSVVLRCGSGGFVGGSGAVTAIADPAASGLPVTNVSDLTCAALPKRSGSISGGLFVKSSTSATLYYVTGGAKRPIDEWSTVAALNGLQAPTIVTMTQASLDTIRTGSRILGPGTLVKSPTAAQIYMIDGTAKKIPISSFDITSEMGVNGYSVIADSALLGSYATTGSPLTNVVACGSTYYFGAQGGLWKMSSPNGNGVPSTPLDPVTCSALPVASAAATPAFLIKTSSDATVYVLDNGSRRPVSSWATAVSLNGGASPVIAIVGSYSMSTIPLGPAI